MMSKLNIPELRFPEFSGEWEEKKLKEITTKIGSGKTPRGGSSVYKKEGIPFLRSQNVQFGALKLDDLVFIDDETDEGMKNSRSYFGDVLLNITGASIGRACMNTLKNTHSNLNQHVSIIRLDSQNSPYFIEQFLISTKGQRSIFRAQSGGSREGLNFAEIGKLKIKLPRIDEQEKIGSFFSKVDRLIELEEKKLELLEEQKKGYMQKIFSQELRFKDENSNGYPEWEKVKLQDIFEYERPDQYIVSTTEYLKQGLPVLTANKAFVLGYTEENNYYDKGNCIIFDDFTLDNKYVNFPFKVKSSAIKILTTKKNYNINFAYYLLNQTKFIKEGHARHYISVIQPTKVKTPCEKEQKKIGEYLRKLDKLHEYHRNKIKLLNREKNGLLQKLFI